MSTVEMGDPAFILRIQDLHYEAPGFSLGPISLDVRKGQVLSVIGPNGAGKTTLLRLISGLDIPTSGKIILRGHDVSSLPPHKRGLGFVFQDLALFPHMTVRQNIEYGLRVREYGKEPLTQRVNRLLEDFNLISYSDRFPRELSGGERQRVAIARSLAPNPSIILLDEPLSSVDPEHRRHFQAELKALLTGLGVTALHVTHDLEEGAYFSDRLAVMMEGKLAQHGDTVEVFLHPLNPRIARFLGYNAWKEGEEWMACLPSAMSLEPPERGVQRRGILLSVGRAIGGLTMMVELPGHQTVRIDVRPVDPWIASLKAGEIVSVAATQVQKLQE